MRNGTGTPQTQRRYYGAVVVVQKIAVGVQQRFLEKIEAKYVPFVDDVSHLRSATPTMPPGLDALSPMLTASRLLMRT